MTRALSDYTLMPLEELTTPKEGRVVKLNRWWLVHDGKALFSEDRPQCNYFRSAVELLAPKGCAIEFIPVAYVPRY